MILGVFGQRRPCQVWQQEPSAPAAVPQPAKLKSAVLSEDSKEQEQKATGPATVDNIVCTNTVTIFNNTFTRILRLPCLPPTACLPHCIENWWVITTDQWILQVVRGYRLELTAPPCQRSQPVTVVTHSNQSLVEEEVQKLLVKGAIQRVSPCPDQCFSRIFLVPKKDGSFRPTAHFKMENLAMRKDLLRKEDWMASIDLKDAYLSVSVSEEHRKYLRLSWMGALYEFQCLPFGLYSAPRVLTKVLKPMLAELRYQGIRLIMYLDDMLVMAQSREELEKQLQQITALLELLEFLVNREKSQFVPTREIQYLGFLIDSRRMKIRLTEEKVTQMMAMCLRV